MKAVHAFLLSLSFLIILSLFALLYFLFKDVYLNISGMMMTGETFLVVGIDTGGKAKDAIGGRTDYMALFYVDQSGTLNLKSIPRDTIITYNGSKRRINSLYNSYGMNTLIQEIEKLTDREITGYIVLDFGTVIAVTDFTGPIRVDVSTPMHHDDFQQQLHIHFDIGTHFLEGEDLLRYLRYRGDTLGDLGRIERQRHVVSQIVSSLLRAGPGKIMELIEYVLDKTEISIEKKTLLRLALSVFTGSRSIQFSQIPYYIDDFGQIIPREPSATAVTIQAVSATYPSILLVNNIPDYETRIGSFSEIIKSQWLKQAGIKVDATGIVPDIPGIEKRETYLFINRRADEVKAVFSLAHVYHNPTVVIISQYSDVEKYYALLDSLSKERLYPASYDAFVLLGVAGR